LLNRVTARSSFLRKRYRRLSPARRAASAGDAALQRLI
jgi:hypothetical protein